MRFTILTFIIAIAAACTATTRPDKLNRAIEHLDSVIAMRDIFKAERIARIDSAKASLGTASPGDSAAILRRIATEFLNIDADSTVRYLDMYRAMSIRNGDRASSTLALIDRAGLLSGKMLYADAIALTDTIDTSILDRSGLISYYSALSRICMGAANVYSTSEEKTLLKQRAITALDSLKAHFPANSKESRFVQAQIDYLLGNMTMGAGELNDILDLIDPSYPAYAIVTAMLAQYYKDNAAKRDEYMYYLALSAASDVRNANGEPASIIALAGELFKDGEVDRAYEYLAAASEKLNSTKSTLLSTELLKPISQVSETIRKREESVKAKYGLTMLAIAFVVAFLIVIYIIERRRNTQLRQRINSLDDSVTNRELYINQLLNICAVYVEGLEDFNRLVGRKLKAGQSKDLYNMIESGKMLQEQTERFFTAFDTAVLRIFPNFTVELNRLLLPDKQISPAGPDKLTPEQRIIAFMRLGVTDSTRISKFLGLSLNTVYTYRNRIKSRAINRDKFESQVLKIAKNT